jgi:cobyrinic acid a,c-diamide synthase
VQINSSKNQCPAWFISAPASNQGKTTVTAALARYHRRQGRNVRVFKTGPDFLDPMILARASGNRVAQLDLWMVGEQNIRRMLYEAAREADLILIEGVMGLYDGDPSSADLAELFQIPVACVIDVHGMAQTFNAIAYGLKNFRKTMPFAGVIANGVASERHAQMLLQKSDDSIVYLGGIARDGAIQLPDRHLGLVQATEIDDLELRLDAAADVIEKSGLTALPELVVFENDLSQPARSIPHLLKGLQIAIARDAAFSFLYDDNLDLLTELGASLVFFSPLNDDNLPDADAVYLPGGYPELHLNQLAANRSMKDALHNYHQLGKKIYAECGGMLYLLEQLSDKEGNTAAMVGLIGGSAVMQTRLAALGFQSIDNGGESLRGHTFHHSLTTLAKPAVHFASRRHDNSSGEPIVIDKGLFASYVHLYFRSNPAMAANFFKREESDGDRG